MSVQTRILYVPDATGRTQTNPLVNRTVLDLPGASEATEKVRTPVALRPAPRLSASTPVVDRTGTFPVLMMIAVPTIRPRSSCTEMCPNRESKPRHCGLGADVARRGPCPDSGACGEPEQETHADCADQHAPQPPRRRFPHEGNVPQHRLKPCACLRPVKHRYAPMLIPAMPATWRRKPRATAQSRFSSSLRHAPKREEPLSKNRIIV